jgi:hypothetical protein
MTEHCPTCGQPVRTCPTCRELMVACVMLDGSPTWRCVGCGHWEGDDVPADTVAGLRWPGE